MFSNLRRWHWNLLHRTWGIPDHDHTEPGASLSTVLHSHPPVPAHYRRHESLPGITLREQLARERARQPRVLKGWQRRIGTTFDHFVPHED